MLTRKIENYLTEWKSTPNKKPLIIKGLRQCGKTYSVLKFAKDNYENVAYFNFLENADYSTIFSGSLDVDNLIMQMSVFLPSTVDFIPGKTIIILDEIQICPEARTALKFFKIDGRFDVICTGSLLGVSGYGYNQPKSIPVGYETTINMYPLDFEEFLWANDFPIKVINQLKDYLENEKPIPEAIHNQLKELLLQYAVVGGMPAVVSKFVETHQLNDVLELQKDIVSDYQDDMIKYAEQNDKAKIRDCFNSIPKQLAKENKKFQYSLVKKRGTSKQFEGSLQWLEDAGIIKRCFNLTMPELPLDGNAINDIFKVYVSDMGLFVSMLEEGTQFDILQGNLYRYKGALFENLIADIFTKNNKKLYYFHKDSGLEIDFVIRYRNEATLVEVKATTGNTKSTKTILSNPEKYHVTQAIKLGDYNIGRTGNILTLPLYMAFLL